MGELTMQEVSGTNMPQVFVSQGALLVMQFSLTAERELPFHCFEELRTQHGVNVTGLTYTLTKRGNVYRRFAMIGCASGNVNVAAPSGNKKTLSIPR